MDPFTMFLMSLVGKAADAGNVTGTGGIAPAPQLGGLLGPTSVGSAAEALGLPKTSGLSALAQANNFGAMKEATQKAENAGISLPPSTPQQNQLLTEENPALKALQNDVPTGFEAFFGNLDNTLSSPSKLLGLGLLGRLGPYAGMGGLLAGGLLGKNKVFR